MNASLRSRIFAATVVAQLAITFNALGKGSVDTSQTPPPPEQPGATNRISLSGGFASLGGIVTIAGAKKIGSHEWMVQGSYVSQIDYFFDYDHPKKWVANAGVMYGVISSDTGFAKWELGFGPSVVLGLRHDSLIASEGSSALFARGDKYYAASRYMTAGIALSLGRQVLTPGFRWTWELQANINPVNSYLGILARGAFDW